MRKLPLLAALALLAAGVACTSDAKLPPALRGELHRVATAPEPALALPAAPSWIADAVCSRAPALGGDCEAVALALHDEASAARLDPVLLLAMIEVESSWDPRAVSDRGARGLMQLLHSTAAAEARRARFASIDPHDPFDALHAGVRYFARLVRAFGDNDLALIAYNAGPNRLRRLIASGAIPTRFLEYPRRVRAEAARLRAALGPPQGPVLTSARDRSAREDRS